MRVHDDGSVTFTKQEIMAMRQALLDEDVQEIRIPSLPVHVVTPNRRRRTIARWVVGCILIALGFYLAFNWTNDNYQTKQSKYIVARVLDAVRVSHQKVPPDEMRWITGTSGDTPEYPLPPRGQEANRLALDSILVDYYASGANDYDILALTISLSIVGTGIGLILLHPLRS